MVYHMPQREDGLLGGFTLCATFEKYAALKKCLASR